MKTQEKKTRDHESKVNVFTSLTYGQISKMLYDSLYSNENSAHMTLAYDP